MKPVLSEFHVLVGLLALLLLVSLPMARAKDAGVQADITGTMQTAPVKTLDHRVEACLKDMTKCKDREVIEFLQMLRMLDDYGTVIDMENQAKPLTKTGVDTKGCNRTRKQD